MHRDWVKGAGSAKGNFWGLRMSPLLLGFSLLRLGEGLGKRVQRIGAKACIAGLTRLSFPWKLSWSYICWVV